VRWEAKRHTALSEAADKKVSATFLVKYGIAFDERYVWN
jgi:hypothetical protein